jgi:hypothetical protein
LVAAPPEVEQAVLQWLDDESAANGDQPIFSKSYGDLIMVLPFLSSSPSSFSSSVNHNLTEAGGR